MNLIDDKFNAKAITRLLDTNRLTFEEVLPEMRQEVMILAATLHEGFEEIPRSFHTPEIASIAAQSLAKQMHYGDVGTDYYEVATKLISDGIGLNHVHPDYIDAKLLLINLQREDEPLRDVTRIIINKFLDKVDINILNFVASRNVDLLDDFISIGFDINSICAESLYEGLTKNLWTSCLIACHGRTDVISKAAKNNFWPGNEVSVDISRPRSLKEAVEYRMKTPDGKSEQVIWLNAYIANFPVMEVARHMNTKARRSVLMDIFSADQLFDLVKIDKDFSGEFLERSMGL